MSALKWLIPKPSGQQLAAAMASELFFANCRENDKLIIIRLE